MSAIKLVYVAGPYAAPTLWGRMVHQAHAAEVARRVVRAGAYPVTPHLCTPPPFEELADAAWWYAATLALMRRCDAVVMVHGWSRSVGALGERAEAERIGLPVFEHVRDLVAWLAGEQQRGAGAPHEGA